VVRLDKINYAVLDGHHKLCAYGREKLDAPTLCIERLAAMRR